MGWTSETELQAVKAQLAAVEAELQAYREGGVTEEILRRHDGYVKIGKGCVLVREDEWSQAQQQLTDAQAREARLTEALEFYADPETYHGCTVLFDRPTGGFDEDFDEGHEGYDRSMPGKKAREALKEGTPCPR